MLDFSSSKKKKTDGGPSAPSRAAPLGTTASASSGSPQVTEPDLAPREGDSRVTFNRPFAEVSAATAPASTSAPVGGEPHPPAEGLNVPPLWPGDLLALTGVTPGESQAAGWAASVAASSERTNQVTAFVEAARLGLEQIASGALQEEQRLREAWGRLHEAEEEMRQRLDAELGRHRDLLRAAQQDSKNILSEARRRAASILSEAQTSSLGSQATFQAGLTLRERSLSAREREAELDRRAVQERATDLDRREEGLALREVEVGTERARLELLEAQLQATASSLEVRRQELDDEARAAAARAAQADAQRREEQANDAALYEAGVRRLRDEFRQNMETQEARFTVRRDEFRASERRLEVRLGEALNDLHSEREARAAEAMTTGGLRAQLQAEQRQHAEALIRAREEARQQVEQAHELAQARHEMFPPLLRRAIGAVGDLGGGGVEVPLPLSLGDDGTHLFLLGRVVESLERAAARMSTTIEQESRELLRTAGTMIFTNLRRITPGVSPAELMEAVEPEVLPPGAHQSDRDAAYQRAAEIDAFVAALLELFVLEPAEDSDDEPLEGDEADPAAENAGED